MSHWGCAIGGCERVFEDVESLLAHQMVEHDSHECRVCGETVPSGFFAIQHVFDQHNRAEYVRHYDADADAIRWRENIKDAVEARVDLTSFDAHTVAEKNAVRVEALD